MPGRRQAGRAQRGYYRRSFTQRAVLLRQQRQQQLEQQQLVVEDSPPCSPHEKILSPPRTDPPTPPLPSMSPPQLPPMARQPAQRQASLRRELTEEDSFEELSAQMMANQYRLPAPTRSSVTIEENSTTTTTITPAESMQNGMSSSTAVEEDEDDGTTPVEQPIDYVQYATQRSREVSPLGTGSVRSSYHHDLQAEMAQLRITRYDPPPWERTEEIAVPALHPHCASTRPPQALAAMASTISTNSGGGANAAPVDRTIVRASLLFDDFFHAEDLAAPQLGSVPWYRRLFRGQRDAPASVGTDVEKNNAEVAQSNAKHTSPTPALLGVYDLKRNDTSNDDKKHKRCLWPSLCLMVLGLVLFAGAVVGVLGLLQLAGVPIFTSSDNYADDGTPPRTEGDPYMTLTIPKDIAKGSYGCSNYPLHAAYNSTRFPQNKNVAELPGNACPAGTHRYTVTECDLLRALQPTHTTDYGGHFRTYIRPYLPHIVRAMEYYDINCSVNRMANWLATVQHETASLSKMKQVADRGAGAIHLIPANYAMAIEQIPDLRKVYQQTERKQFEDVLSLAKLKQITNSGAPLTAQENAFLDRVGDLLVRPEFTFMIAGWWYREGAKEVLGPIAGCDDLRTDADQGVGTGAGTPAATGFYKVSRCVFGTAPDAGLEQRVEFLNKIQGVAYASWKCQTVQCKEESSAPAAAAAKGSSTVTTTPATTV